MWSVATAAFGLLMLMNTFATMKAIAVIFGLWMLLTGLQLIHSGWSMKARSSLGWIMLGAGVLSAAAATMMILNVRTGAIGVSTLLGLQVMLAGIALVLLSVAKKVVAVTVTSQVDFLEFESVVMTTRPLREGVILAVLLLFAAAEPASAHVQTGQAQGFLTGFRHPVSGLDHVLAMIAVGLWGAQLSAPAIWLLPVTFPMVMAVGGFLGLVGVPLPGVEIGIALSARFSV